MIRRLIQNIIKPRNPLREARSSLNRVTYLLENYNTALLTGYRKENTKKVNFKKNKEIKKVLKQNQLSWVDVKGTYIEQAKLVRKQKDRRVDDNNANPKNYDILGKYVYENSLLVIDNKSILSNEDFYNLIERLGIENDQDSVVINIQGTNPLLLATNDTEYMKKGDFFDLTDRMGGEKFITYNSPSITVYSSLGGSANINIDNIFLDIDSNFVPSKKIFTIGQGLPIKPTQQEIDMSDEEYDELRKNY